MIRSSLCWFVFAVPLVFGVAASASDPEPSPEQPYTATPSAPVIYDIDFRVIVTAPVGTKKLRVWVPIALDDLGQKVTAGDWSVFPDNVNPTFQSEKVFGNRFAYFEIANPQGAQIISHTFTATVWQLDWNVDSAKVQRVEKWPAAFDAYRRAERGIVINDRVKTLAGDIAGKAGPTGELSAVMDWVQANMTYDHSTTSLVASTEHALTKKRGDCSDYHGLCSSLGRVLGVPTRVTYGLHLFPKNLPCHCKLEAYLPPHGWVSFDVSETQRLVKAIEAADKLTVAEKKELATAAVARLRRGFRDNTWLMMTKGTDYDLAPKAASKVPLVPTIYAEADGKPLPLPDPADPTKREFAWMTAHKYTTSKPVAYPFKDWGTLKTQR
ncbi:MAG: transglutaminase domain-containing protein [Planctomycetes bacterium]|nr:transglutaminase domain-containing protein [Planctomycetota bacterium]